MTNWNCQQNLQQLSANKVYSGYTSPSWLPCCRSVGEPVRRLAGGYRDSCSSLHSDTRFDIWIRWISCERWLTTFRKQWEFRRQAVDVQNVIPIATIMCSSHPTINLAANTGAYQRYQFGVCWFAGVSTYLLQRSMCSFYPLEMTMLLCRIVSKTA